MARASGARRYAQAAFELALERKELDGWQADLEALARVLLDPELGPVLDSPRVPFRDKMGLIREGLPQASPLVHHLAFLLVARGRRGLVGRVAAEFQRLADAHRGIEHARVTTALPLEAADMGRLGQGLASLLGRGVVVEADVDPSIIGGFVARVGDKLIDGSTRSRLEALKKALSGTA